MVFITLINKYLAILEKWMATFSTILTVCMMSIVMIDILGRLFFNAPLSGSYELLSFSLGGIALLSFAYIQQKHRNITVDILTEKFPTKINLFLQLFWLVLILVVFVLITIEGGKAATDAWQKGEFTYGLVKLPLGPAKMVVPFGGGVLCLRFILQIFETITQLFKEQAKKVGV